jgi:bifunctional UDP-N-acetylglucosamine pyrophosphorylase/glucosamine-1-phosphate N-acetyltransferase
MRWAVTVLAAGQGTRLKSSSPKVMHELAGRGLIDHVLDLALSTAAPDDVIVVVGHGADVVRARVASRGVRTALQEPQLGTGDALRVALGAISEPTPDGVLVLSGDVPLLRPTTLARLQRTLLDGAEAVLLSAELEEPGGYGRVVRAADGGLREVIEARDADPEVLAIREVNAGVYAFRLASLGPALNALRPDNAQGEYYLTDVVAQLVRSGSPVAAVRLDDADEMAGVNTRADLARVAAILNRRVLDGLMGTGVSILDPATTWVDPDCRVAADAVLEPGVILRRGSHIGGGARIGAHSVLDGAEVAEGETVPPLTHRTG